MLIGIIGILINSFYGIELLQQFFRAETDEYVRHILVSAISLEIGWAILLIPVIIRPFEQRRLLLFTAIPMALANILHSIGQWMYSDTPVGHIGINFFSGLLIAGIFAGTSLLKPINKRKSAFENMDEY